MCQTGHFATTLIALNLLVHHRTDALCKNANRDM